jgi:hypothetical protein
MAGTDDQHDQQPDGTEPAEAHSSDRIWLEVSILASAASSTPQREDEARDPALVEATVLIVARDADMRAYIRDCLSATGLRLFEASELASPSAANAGHVDLLIIDLSGLEHGSKIARVPRVLISDEPHYAGHVASEIVAVLAKPFNARGLQLEVMRCLSRRFFPPHNQGGTQ